ncbi:MAG: 2-dehydro-3-deoxy-6-phosphogalactonate aldolase [Hyphomicrobiales bacterium]|nr:2-dehydro-3-deoxy-6-phosphogalactonate aldolase [Hyphomicrobiales bacterium]MBV9520065.1 2-dehydro-3-deoxy-6-phosphogalactonate aldolase [Hyphomicrobiales bacterium]
MRFDEALAGLPLIAILRGLRPEQAVDIATALFDAGFRILEVPLNSPSPLASIERIAARFTGRMLIGAGTVLDANAVGQVADAGARLIVSPNFEAAVVHATKKRDLVSVPGVATPSEAFAALAAGADALKLFPAEMISPKVVRSIRAVLPKETRLLPVGGIGLENIPAYREAGADGFGIGSALFKPGMSVAQVAQAAMKFVERMRRHD